MAPPTVRARHGKAAKAAAGEILAMSEVPDILEIKRALPDEVFRPSAAKSLAYAAFDVALATALAAGMRAASAAAPALFPLYWAVQGTVFWALFVVGHDCGHGSFSSLQWLNEAVGLAMHTAILVPYTPWKESHRHHHKNTGNIDTDEIFFPTRERIEAGFLRSTGYFGLGVAWFAYLAVGYSPRAVCHLNPSEPLFSRHRTMATVSVTSWALALYGVALACRTYGAAAVAAYYLAPVFVMASWLVVTTFLHHQDESLPWYAGEEWNYVRGNLSSIDRPSYGRVVGWLTHNIGTHHIVHHLFPAIPHYNLPAATEAFRAAYPHLYRQSDEPVWSAFTRGFRRFAAQANGIGADTKVFRYTHQE